MHGETPLTVTAVTNHDKPEEYPRVDDDATIILQYPKTQAVIQASWNWPFSRRDIEMYGPRATPSRWAKIKCASGSSTKTRSG